MKTQYFCLLVLLVASACDRQGQAPGVPGGGKPASESETPQLVLQVRDSESGSPVLRCSIVGYRRGAELSSVTPRGPNVAADGNHHFTLVPGTTRVKIGADGYSESWSEPFVVSPGREVSLSMSLRPLAHLVVHVRSTDGKAVQAGTLLLLGNDDFEQALNVKDGLIDMRVDAVRGALVVDPESMPGFRPGERPIQLQPGKLTEVTVDLQPL